MLAMADLLTRLRPLLSRGNCLERSLLGYRYLARAGLEPSLVVGVHATMPAPSGATPGSSWTVSPCGSRTASITSPGWQSFVGGGQVHPQGAKEPIPPTKSIDGGQYWPSVP